jgi:hypothetical protein
MNEDTAPAASGDSEEHPIGSLAGAFPELASLTDADLAWAKEQWQRGAERQLELLSAQSLTDWDRLDAMQDEDIDLSDVPELTSEMVANAQVRCDGQPLSRSPSFQGLLARSRASIQEGKGLSHDDFWRAVADLTREAAETDNPAVSGATQSE